MVYSTGEIFNKGWDVLQLDSFIVYWEYTGSYIYEKWWWRGPYYEWDPTWERYFFSIEKAIIDFDFLISLDTVIEEGIGIDGDEIVIEPTDKAFIISCLDVGGSELEGYHYGDYWGNVAAPQVGGDMSYLGWDYETSRPDAYIWGKEQYERWFQRG